MPKMEAFMFRMRHIPIIALLGVVPLAGCSTSDPSDSSSRLTESITSTTAGGIRLAFPASWTVDGRANLPRLGRPGATMTVASEQRLTAAESLERLQEIEGEWPGPVDHTTVNGYPAIERVRTAAAPLRGRLRVVENRPPLQHVTLAIAAGAEVVRIEGIATDASLVDEMLDIARHTHFVSGVRDSWRGLVPSLGSGSEIGTLSQGLEEDDDEGEDDDVFPPPTDLTPVPSDRIGMISRVNSAAGIDAEIEVAVSNNGQFIVTVNNSRDYTFSTDWGMTFTQRFDTSGAGADQGDPSIAFAASGTFYTAHIRQPDGSVAALGQTGCATEIGRSTDNGQNFTIRGYAALSPASGNGVFFPDQEHIAADRTNLSATNQDQLYSVWRDFRPITPKVTDVCGNVGSSSIPASVVPRIMCSTDGGATWGNSTIVAASGDFPRIGVGGDGFVYVVYQNGANLMLDKFSSCANGLAQQAGFPKTVAGGINGVDCGTIPVPAGLDRCNGNNTLASPMVSVDDTNSQHVYLAYANSTAAGSNEDVFLRDSNDGGVTWTRPAIRMNTNVNAHRFMPWVCSTGGTAFVSWYDQRLGVAGVSNDLTDLFGASASLDGSGNLTQRSELRISQVSDPLCASGWPSTPNTTTAPESCPTQPQRAGACSVSGAACDFSNCAGGGGTGACECPAGQTCQAGRGFPKYGDYNGNACAAGRFYTAWASATSPPGTVPASTSIDVFAACPPDANLAALSFNDTTKPFFPTAPAPVTRNDCGPIFLPTPAALDICGTAPVNVTGNAPATFPRNLTVVTWTATDQAGNSASIGQSVTVNDTTGPVFSNLPLAPLTVTDCTAASLPKPSAIDACGGQVTVSSNAPAKLPLGPTTVTWTATDVQGNATTTTQLVTAGLGDNASCCPNGTNIIVGTNASNNLVGTSGSDCIIGLGGNDVINGFDGDDFISGGDGSDQIAGGNGNDYIVGGNGNDVIDSGPNNDFIDGSAGVDTCSGGSGTADAITNCEVSSFCTAACCSTASCTFPPAAPGCGAPFAKAQCLSYVDGTVVFRAGHNWQCLNGNCRNCAGFASCEPGATGCPWGAVWSDVGSCL
jgi:hypothetical protein